MSNFSAELLREKFVFCQKDRDDKSRNNDIDNLQKAMGNRLRISLSSKNDPTEEEFIIRAQNMHVCLRIGAHIAYHFFKNSTLTGEKSRQFPWQYIYNAVTHVFEKKWNPNIWAAVYSKGKCLFKAGDAYQPLLEVVEQSIAFQKGPYSKVVSVVEEMFEKSGNPVRVDYNCEPVIKLSGTEKNAKIHLLKRGPEDKEIIKISIKRKKRRNIGLAACLNASAAILEAFQLGFFAAKVNEQVIHKKLALANKEVMQGDQAARRISGMQRVLMDFETEYQVIYKPRAPSFEGFSHEVSEYFDNFYLGERKKKSSSETLDELPPTF